MAENNAEVLTRALARVAVLSGTYMGRNGESIAKATFRAKYTYLQQVKEEVAEQVYELALGEGINPDNILEISCMGYTHEQIENMLKAGRAMEVVYLILHFRIYPRE